MDVRVIGHHDFKRPLVSKADAFKIISDDVLGMVALITLIFVLIFWPHLPAFFAWIR